MPQFRSIHSRRKRKSLSKSVIELPLTSMMDILVIILVFLLKSYTSSQSNFVAGEGEMPFSASKNIPPDSHHLVITKDYIAFEDEKVMYFLAEGQAVTSPAPAGGEDADAGFQQS